MNSEYLYKNIEFNPIIAKEIIPVILLKNSVLKREKIIEMVYLYHILNGGLKSKTCEKSTIINAIFDLKEKGILEQPNLGYYKLSDEYQSKTKLGDDSLIKLPFDKKTEDEVNVEDLEIEIKNMCFNLLKNLSSEERKEIYKNILQKFELKCYKNNIYNTEKNNIDTLKVLIKNL